MKRIRISFSSLIVIAVSLLSSDRIYIIPLLISAITHEFGHLAAAKLLKIPIERMTLDILGARIHISNRLISYKKEWLLCFAGPFVNLLLGLVSAVLCKGQANDGPSFLLIFCVSSFALGTLNLLPIETFDGGRMAKCFFSCLTSVDVAEKTVKCMSICTIFMLWLFSTYIMIRKGAYLSLFAFSVCLFCMQFDKKRSGDFRE